MGADVSLYGALVLGLAYAALPGVVNTECVRRRMAFGFGAAARIQIGALIGDAACAAVALTGAALISQHQAVALVLGIVGAGFLFPLARTAFVSALGNATSNAPAPKSGSSLGTGVVFSLANPAGLAFWTGVGGGLLGAAGGSVSVEAAARSWPGGGASRPRLSSESSTRSAGWRLATLACVCSGQRCAGMAGGVSARARCLADRGQCAARRGCTVEGVPANPGRPRQDHRYRLDRPYSVSSEIQSASSTPTGSANGIVSTDSRPMSALCLYSQTKSPQCQPSGQHRPFPQHL